MILQVVSSVSSALRYLHEEKRLLHGDVKGANILVKGDFEQVKLCDFGVTLRLDENMAVAEEEEETYVGTGPFTPLEAMAEGEDQKKSRVTDRADIFSLGCVIYEMLALEAPHVNLLKFDEDDGKFPLSFLSVKVWNFKSVFLYDGCQFAEEAQEEAEDAYDAALGMRPELPENLEWVAKDDGYRQVLSLFYACTEQDPSRRPSAAAIVDLLKGSEEKKKEDTKESK